VPSETTGATGLSGRYASALFDLAEAKDKLEVVEANLLDLLSMVKGSDDLYRLIKSPVISRKDQGKAMAEICKKSGFDDLIGRFVGVVSENRRLFALPSIVFAFSALMAERRGEATADVSSAQALTKDQIDKIKTSLKKTLGKNIAVNPTVDESLLGGLIVKVGSRMVDSSLRTKLQQLRLVMKGVG
jgi:F-type H+-transporting ATPase subunit delta